MFLYGLLNPIQVGTVYDQNHIDNHRNSMAGQSLLVELEHGDRVQVGQVQVRNG